MKRFVIVSALLLQPCLAFAQQQSMSGMDMSTPTQPQQKRGEKKQQPMPGMKTNMGDPKDMQMSSSQSDQSMKDDVKSIQNSEQQQKGQAGVVPGRGSDAQSINHATMTLQEPENPDHLTGQSLPAPELLNDVVKRTPMGIEDFAVMAEKNNPTLAQARSYVRRSEQQGRQAGLYPNPSIGYSGEHIRGGEYGGGEQGAYVQQEIVLGGKLGLRRNIYQQEAKVDQIGVDEQKYRVKDSVEQAFYQALAAQALVVVRQRLLNVTLDALETAHQLANVGQADAPDTLQAEVEAEQAKVAFVRAQREYIQQFYRLAAVAGAEHLEVSPLKGELEKTPVIDPGQQVAAILSDSPTVKHAEKEVLVAEARLKESKREPIPNLTVKAGEWWSGETIESSQQPAGPMSFVDASIKLPVWNRNQGNTEAAKADLERSKEEVLRTRLMLKQEAEPLVQEYLSSSFEADRYRTELLPRARRAYELYLMKYQQMAVAYPQVLISQRTLFQLQIDYLDALSSVWRNALALQNYTLQNGLEMPMGAGANGAVDRTSGVGSDR